MKKFIDIEGLIRDKNPKLLKWLPGFVVRYIQKITHEVEVNDAMYRFREKKGKDFCSAVVEDFNITVKMVGLENIPKEGGCLFASNHPLGGLDAMAIVHGMHDIRPDMKFIVNDVLLSIENLKMMFQGVNKYGKTAKESLKAVMELFASDQAVFIFPAGLVSRKKNGVIEDLVWKKTFISQAKRHNKTVIPVFVSGNLSKFFYRLSNFRTKIGIKANIEMMYLADEMYKKRNSTITVVFGEPISSETFDKSKSDLKWAEWMKAKAYALKSFVKE